jgi:hypothetical protein
MKNGKYLLIAVVAFIAIFGLSSTTSAPTAGDLPASAIDATDNNKLAAAMKSCVGAGGTTIPHGGKGPGGSCCYNGALIIPSSPQGCSDGSTQGVIDSGINGATNNVAGNQSVGVGNTQSNVNFSPVNISFKQVAGVNDYRILFRNSKTGEQLRGYITIDVVNAASDVVGVNVRINGKVFVELTSQFLQNSGFSRDSIYTAEIFSVRDGVFSKTPALAKFSPRQPGLGGFITNIANRIFNSVTNLFSRKGEVTGGLGGNK